MNRYIPERDFPNTSFLTEILFVCALLLLTAKTLAEAPPAAAMEDLQVTAVCGQTADIPNLTINI